jgi:hypothetical protein
MKTDVFDVIVADPSMMESVINEAPSGPVYPVSPVYPVGPSGPAKESNQLLEFDPAGGSDPVILYSTAVIVTAPSSNTISVILAVNMIVDSAV